MRSWLLAVAVAVAAAVATAGAHEKFKIVGKVAGLKKDEIAVKAIDGATYEIDMHADTPVTDKQHKKIMTSSRSVRMW